MADFTEYGIPSAEWLAFEPSIPEAPKLSVEQLRESMNKSREAASATSMIEEGLSSKIQMHDHQITTRDGSILEARTYRPVGIPLSQPLPLYIYLHGGGWFFGTLSSEDAPCSRIVVAQEEQGTPMAVFNLNYRHTPEHKYPTAWNDAEDAFIWVHEHISEIGALADQVVVGGVSAGASLTASLARGQFYGENERIKTLPKIIGQVLMIPCVSLASQRDKSTDMLRSPDLSSMVQCAEAPILPLSRIQLFGQLLGLDAFPDAESDLRMNPGNATPEEVRQLPPTVFGIAGRDPLRDQGLYYAKLLSENGVPTNVTVFRGLPHGYRRFGKGLDRACKKWDESVNEGISWILTNPEVGTFEIKTD
ncbi:hypothetical protein N7540_004971 [Penicillium herquei]|nr:hypothetical protein N7540_004971 [Penicillium herquei]